MNIDQLQLDLIQKSKRYIARKNENGLDTASLAEAFFVVGDAPGYYILKNFIDGKRSLLNKVYIYFKFLYAICKLSG